MALLCSGADLPVEAHPGLGGFHISRRRATAARPQGPGARTACAGQGRNGCAITRRALRTRTTLAWAPTSHRRNRRAGRAPAWASPPASTCLLWPIERS